MLSTAGSTSGSFLGPERKKTHRAAATATFSMSDRQKWHPHCSHSHFSDFQCSDRPFLTTWIASRNRTVAAEILPFWTFDPALDASLQVATPLLPRITERNAQIPMLNTSLPYSYRCIAEEAEFCVSQGITAKSAIVRGRFLRFYIDHVGIEKRHEAASIFRKCMNPR